MKTQTIKVEGLPEGWKGVSISIPTYGQSYWNGHNVCVAGTPTPGYAYLIVEKIKPREIRLVETSERNPAYNSAFETRFVAQNSEYIWREVTPDDQPKMGVSEGDGKGSDLSLNSDEPKLSLGVDECKKLLRCLSSQRIDKALKLKKFIKGNDLSLNNDEPKLSLSVDQCKELLEVTAHRNDTSDILDKFIKGNS